MPHAAVLRGPRARALALVVAPALCACDSAGTEVAGRSVRDASPPDAGPARSDPSLSIVVLEPRAPATTLPVANALVVLDRPGAGRAQLTTDAQGRVSFERVDLSQAAATVTVIEPRHQVTTWLGVTTSFTALVAPLDPSEGTVALRGALRNNRAPVVNLSPVGRGRNYQGGGPGYDVRVEPAAPIALVSFEWSGPSTPTVGPRGVEQTIARWARFDSASVTNDATADIDLDAIPELTPAKARVRVVVPGGDDGPLGRDSRASWVVTTAESGMRALLGTTTHGDVTNDPSVFELEGEHVRVDGPTIVTRFAVLRGEGLGSTRLKVGAPVDGETIDDLLVPPAVPRDARADAPIAIEGLAPGAAARLSIEDGIGTVRWVVHAGSARSVALPSLPQAGALVVQNASVGHLAAVADFDPRLFVYTRVAAGRRFSITR